MPEPLLVVINGGTYTVAAGTTVAAALLLAGQASRLSITGEARAPMCGMGTCYECRAIVDGIAHRRTCQMACREGMVVTTQ